VSSGRRVGLQAERTYLAWKRTSLSVLASAAVLLRLSFESLGVIGFAGFVVCVVAVGIIAWASRCRYRVAVEALGSGGSQVSDGLACLMLALTICALGMLTLTWIGVRAG
jgi:uncharacterized membrane protein YidH (DUF202 family)